ncbi:MAG: hypothetical protein ACRC1D_08925, partial [Culicoidibacterales bacterium]
KEIALSLKNLLNLETYFLFVERDIECVQLNLMPTQMLNSNSVFKQKYDVLIYRKNKFQAYEDALKIQNNFVLPEFYSFVFESNPTFVGRTDSGMNVVSLEMKVVYKK